MSEWKPDPEYLEMFRHPERIGPIVAHGVEDYWHWQYRASIRDGQFLNWFDIRDAQGNSTAGSGGGAGALPFDDVGYKKLRHFGSLFLGGPKFGPPRHLGGVVSHEVERVIVEFEDGTARDAVLVDIDDPAGKPFVDVSSLRATRLVAIGADNSQLESWEPESPR